MISRIMLGVQASARFFSKNRFDDGSTEVSFQKNFVLCWQPLSLLTFQDVVYVFDYGPSV